MIGTSLRRTVESLLDLRVLALVFVPWILAAIFWGGLLIFSWTAWVGGLAGWFEGFWLMQKIAMWFNDPEGVAGALWFISAIAVVLFILPVTFVSAILLTSLIVVPWLLTFVVPKEYPGLEKKKGGSALGGVWNSAVATVLYMVALIVTLPLWLLPGFSILIPMLLNSWLNKKVFVYDVLQDYASHAERKAIESKFSSELWSVGLVSGVLSYIPLVFIVLPVSTALLYMHFCLQALQNERKA